MFNGWISGALSLTIPKGRVRPVFAPLMGAWLFGLAASAQAAEVITWVTSNNPPTFIENGDLAGQGSGDQALRTLIQNLPDFSFHVIRGSPARVWYEMAHHDGVCTFGSIRTAEREKIGVFSNRPLVVPGYRFVFRQDHAGDFKDLLTADGAVDLEAVAKDDRLAGSYVSTRPYFSSIEQFIDNPARLAKLVKMPEPGQLFGLLQAGRTDFAFISGLELAYFTATTQSNIAITALPIKDSPSHVEGYLACSNQPEGRAAIAKIDEFLADDRHWAAFIAPLQPWLDPADYAASLAAKPLAPQ